MTRAKTFKCAVNLGLAGQLTEEAMFDAILGIKFDVTTSASTWGHGDSPVRHYLNAFVFMDTKAIPLIGKAEGTIITLKRTKRLPETRETFFKAPIFRKEPIVGIWSAETAKDNEILVRCLRNSVGWNYMRNLVNDATEELKSRVETRVGAAVLFQRMKAAKANEAILAADAAAEMNPKTPIREELRQIAKTRAELSSANNHLAELDRVDSMVNRKLVGLDTLPEGVTVTIIQVNTKLLKDDEIPSWLRPATITIPPRIVPEGPNKLDTAVKPRTVKVKGTPVPSVLSSVATSVRTQRIRNRGIANATIIH
jgi:hypothetical protein